MRYVIKESQLKLILESSPLLMVMRRVNKDSMGEFVRNAELEFPMLCDEFSDGMGYVDAVIRWAVDDFLPSDENIFLDELYDEVSDKLVSLCKNWFGEYLLNIYRITCIENV